MFTPSKTDSRFSPVKTSPPTIYAVLNLAKPPPKRGAPRKSFIVSFGIVADPSQAEETSSEKSVSVKGKEKAGPEMGKWDVLARREVATKPVTVFDVR